MLEGSTSSGVGLSPEGDRARRQINLTPLIDVVFLLIIFFMVTTTFRKELKLLQLTLPTAKNIQFIQLDKTITITINKSSQIEIDGLDGIVEINDLRSALIQAKKTGAIDVTDESGNRKKTYIILVQGDREADYGIMVKILDIAKDLGIENIAFLTELEE